MPLFNTKRGGIVGANAKTASVKKTYRIFRNRIGAAQILAISSSGYVFNSSQHLEIIDLATGKAPVNSDGVPYLITEVFIGDGWAKAIDMVNNGADIILDARNWEARLTPEARLLDC